MRAKVPQYAKGIAVGLATCLIFASSLSTPAKNFAYGLLCLTIMLAFLVKGPRGEVFIPRAAVLLGPCLVWMVLLTLNLLCKWNISTWALWASFYLLYFVGFFLAVKYRLDEIEEAPSAA